MAWGLLALFASLRDAVRSGSDVAVRPPTSNRSASQLHLRYPHHVRLCYPQLPQQKQQHLGPGATSFLSRLMSSSSAALVYTVDRLQTIKRTSSRRFFFARCAAKNRNT